jgi:hypothetical protein
MGSRVRVPSRPQKPLTKVRGFFYAQYLAHPSKIHAFHPKHRAALLLFLVISEKQKLPPIAIILERLQYPIVDKTFHHY